ncbi:hypothetical protein GGH96_006186 [Coemansia sp. RSA 1972]|nr:hypothetical protein GGH96_006186 [Coemansia sp. RSA 1972]
MLDHILGKPSANVRRVQALGTALVTLLVTRRKKAPWGLGWLERRSSLWKTLLGWWTLLYLLRHMDDVLGLHAPEPLREYYSRSFYRATWVFTALDAGFWTAMSVRPKWLRDTLSLVFSAYYLVCTNRAVEKVRKVRALVTIEHLRVSWNKGVDNPVLRFVRKLHQPQLGVVRNIMLGESESTERARCVVMFNGSEEEFRACRMVVLDVPGGGFVSMAPESHTEYLAAWAQRTKAIVVSVDYAKAPEYPFPYAIDQCFAVYRELELTNGQCIGLEGTDRVRFVLAGDSAGANIAAGVQFRILESEGLRGPAGIVFVYGCFNVDVRAWMTRSETRVLLGTEARDHLHHASPLAVAKPTRHAGSLDARVRVVSGGQPSAYVPLTMTSSFTYFNDQVLTPEMMRAMVIMYVGPNARPDFRTDYYLSPVVAPDHLLARFPPTYFLCGEKDPMVDDTVLFASRIRNAKQPNKDAANDNSAQADVSGRSDRYCAYRGSALYRRRHSQPRVRNSSSTRFYIGSTDVSEDEDQRASHVPRALRMTQFDEPHTQNGDAVIKVKLVAGMSHGFLQMYSLLPEARKVAAMCGEWLDELLHDAHSISPYSRCASEVRIPPSSDKLAINVMDRYGVEIVSAANMVRRRGHGLADPLS